MYYTLNHTAHTMCVLLHTTLEVQYTILYYTILYYTILCYTILYYTMPYYTILYYAILCYTILYYRGTVVVVTASASSFSTATCSAG